MANISISQMNTRAEANLSDLHEVAYADSNSQTGYANTDYFSADGVHLNGAGYRLLLDYAGKHQYN